MLHDKGVYENCLNHNMEVRWGSRRDGKVFSFMANAFSEIGNDVFAIYRDKAEGAPAFKLSNNVNIVNAYKKTIFLAVEDGNKYKINKT